MQIRFFQLFFFILRLMQFLLSFWTLQVFKECHHRHIEPKSLTKTQGQLKFIKLKKKNKIKLEIIRNSAFLTEPLISDIRAAIVATGQATARMENSSLKLFFPA